MKYYCYFTGYNQNFEFDFEISDYYKTNIILKYLNVTDQNIKDEESIKLNRTQAEYIVRLCGFDEHSIFTIPNARYYFEIFCYDEDEDDIDNSTL